MSCSSSPLLNKVTQCFVKAFCNRCIPTTHPTNSGAEPIGTGYFEFVLELLIVTPRRRQDKAHVYYTDLHRITFGVHLDMSARLSIYPYNQRTARKNDPILTYLILGKICSDLDQWLMR